MKRFMMLVWVVSSGCGTLMNVGDETGNEDALRGARSCGATTCQAGEVCCNASCGICTAPGGACTQQLCGSPPPPVDAGQQCGPVCAIYCEYGNVLDANGCPTCACNPPPADAGQQCGAVCAIYCEYGNVLDANGCPTCACNPAPADGGSGGGVTCGRTTCGAGEECCNASCGICVQPGGACTQQICN